ncbi:hypothetical protein H311_01790 [Anncaliia algerae PRA109]|nr:hypothetical protein H311_01790 [Anncaliia algerae PRA109]
MGLPLKHKDDSNDSHWENSFVYYQFRSLRTYYAHDDLEFLKAVFMTKHPEIFKL